MSGSLSVLRAAVLALGFLALCIGSHALASDPASPPRRALRAYVARLDRDLDLLFRPRHGQRIALTTGLLSGNRNMALYLAVMPPETGFDVLIFFAFCQFPLFLSPFLLRPVYLRLIARI